MGQHGFELKNNMDYFVEREKFGISLELLNLGFRGNIKGLSKISIPFDVFYMSYLGIFFDMSYYNFKQFIVLVAKLKQFIKKENKSFFSNSNIKIQEHPNLSSLGLYNFKGKEITLVDADNNEVKFEFDNERYELIFNLQKPIASEEIKFTFTIDEVFLILLMVLNKSNNFEKSKQDLEDLISELDEIKRDHSNDSNSKVQLSDENSSYAKNNYDKSFKSQSSFLKEIKNRIFEYFKS